MKISLTVREIFAKGLWLEVCEIKHIWEWAVNEGMMDNDEVITFTEEEAKKLGLIT